MSEKPWWIGIRASDIKGVEDLFAGTVSIVGAVSDSKIGGFSVESELGRRLDHNNFTNEQLITDQLDRIVKLVLAKNPEARFLFQDQLCFSNSEELWQRAVYNNPAGLLAPLNDKGIARSIFGRYVPTVGSTMMFAADLSYAVLRKMFQSERFVVQIPTSAGGHGSFLINSETSAAEIRSLGAVHVVVSEYHSVLMPMNSHVVIFADEVLTLPPSAQLVSTDCNGRLLYGGCDFFLHSRLPTSAQALIHETCLTLGNILRRVGYRGVAGFDYLVGEDEILFVEVNPRFQASTAQLNRALLDQQLPSVHELHMAAFEGGTPPVILTGFEAQGATILLFESEHSVPLPAGQHEYQSPDTRDTVFSKDHVGINIELDGLKAGIDVEKGAAIGRAIVDRGVLYFDPIMGPLANHALTQLGRQPPRLLEAALAGDQEALTRLKFNLFTFGTRLTPATIQHFATERESLTIRDGIAGGLEMKLPHSVHVNVPIKEHFALLSPYSIDCDPRDNLWLIDLNGDALPVTVLPIPDFVGKKTSRGTPMVDVGQMFNERLSVEIFYGCVNSRKKGTACHFCELGAEAAPHYANISDIRELVAYCEASPTIPMRHVLIGGGTPPERQWERYFDALAAVKAETTVPIYLMIAPPSDLGRLEQLHARGVNEIGMNLEVYDRHIARNIMPAKGKLSRERYFSALEQAVRLWGGQGAVRSILIVGLEPLASTLAGVEALSKRGVLPILSPYRPIPGTPLADRPPPSPDFMYEAWERSMEISIRHGLSLGPLCIACQNNTIAMPFGQEYRYY